MNKKQSRTIIYAAALFLVIIWALIFSASGDSSDTLVLILLAASCIVFVLLSIAVKSEVEESVAKTSKYYDITNKYRVNGTDETLHDYDDKIKEYFTDIKGEQQLLETLYSRFVMIQEALSNGYLDFLKDHCIESLYESLCSEYNNYSSKEEKHILDQFVLHAYNIKNITIENQTISIQMSLHISNRDYVIDKSKKVIEGNADKVKHKQYLLDFVIDKDKKIICPNCGAHVSTKECEYCNTVFKDVYYDFTLAKIGLIENQDKM